MAEVVKGYQRHQMETRVFHLARSGFSNPDQTDQPKVKKDENEKTGKRDRNWNLF